MSDPGTKGAGYGSGQQRGGDRSSQGTGQVSTTPRWDYGQAQGYGGGVFQSQHGPSPPQGGWWWNPPQGGQYQGGHAYHGGAPPQSGQFPPVGQMPRDWRIGWTDNHHPKIKSMMQKYLEHTHGQIHLAEILAAAGKTQTDLPTLPKYVHPTGRPFLCWASVLGKCGFWDCRFRKEGGHPIPGDITEEFADQVIDVF